MDNNIPCIIEILYHYFVGEPHCAHWSDHLKDVPMTGHGLWAFYQGLRLGIRLMNGCLDLE